MEQKNNMLHEEDLTQITALGIVGKEEAEYYIAALKTSCRIVNASGISSTETPDEIIGIVFSKIASNVFWLRDQENQREQERTKENQREQQEEKKNTEKDRIMKAATEAGMQVQREKEERAKEGNVPEGFPEFKEDEPQEQINNINLLTVADVIGKEIKILGISVIDDVMTIKTTDGEIETTSKVLIRQLGELADMVPFVGQIRKEQSKNGRGYYKFVASRDNKKNEFGKTASEELAAIKKMMEV